MIRYVFGLLILTSVLSAQYTFNDIELVKTTYTQQYNKNIILPYLQSDDPQKVKAALLSIAQSHDTSFVTEILKLNFESYGNYISFALGQLGESETSTEYLFLKLNNTPASFKKVIYEALGRTGSLSAYKSLLMQYRPDGASSGISQAIANFNSRNISDSTGRVFTILSKEYFNKNFNLRTRTEALFSLSRLEVPQYALKDLGELLKEKHTGDEGVWFLQYALAAVRNILSAEPLSRLSAFGGIKQEQIIDQIRILIRHSDWRIRTEAVKVFCFSYFESEDDVKLYFSLLSDTNPNVARQAAISLSTVLLTDENRELFYEQIKKHLDEPELSPAAKGELFISFTKLFPDELHKIVNQYENSIDKNYLYNALGQNKHWRKQSIFYLLKNPPSDNLQKINYYNNLVALRLISSEATDSTDQLIINNLNSSVGPVITVISEGLDSAFIQRHRSELSSIIISCIKERLNNPDFSEAVISLSSLASRIDSILYKQTLNILSGSSLYVVQKFTAAEFKTAPPLKTPDNFEILWSNAFKYKTAKVITTKGEFVIKFNPGYAPISTGNFSYLAEKGYFNNVKFHRVVPNFVIQTGDPQSTGWGGPGYEIISEFSPLDYLTGTVGMASAGKDTEGSQWFVTHSYFPHLNGRYTIFGHIIQGMDVVNTIDQGDEVVTIELNK